MYAFVCSQSAVDAIRSLSARGAWGGDPAWPESPRALPLWGDCVCSQRSFAEFTRENDPSVLEGLFPPVDLLVPSSRFRSSGKSAKFHVWSREIPAGACRRLSERLVISGPEFAIVQLARSLGKFDSLFDGFMVELREQKGASCLRRARGRVRGGAAAEVGTNSPPGRARLACLRVRGDVSPRRGNARSVRERPCEEELRTRVLWCRRSAFRRRLSVPRRPAYWCSAFRFRCPAPCRPNFRFWCPSFQCPAFRFPSARPRGHRFWCGPGYVRLFPARVLRAPAGARPLGAPKG